MDKDFASFQKASGFAGVDAAAPTAPAKRLTQGLPPTTAPWPLEAQPAISLFSRSSGVHTVRSRANLARPAVVHSSTQTDARATQHGPQWEAIYDSECSIHLA